MFDWSLSTSASADWSVELSTVASWCWSAPDASPSMATAEDPWPWVTYWSVMFSLPASAELSAEFDWSTDPPPPPPTDVGALVLDWSLSTSASADWSVEFDTSAD